MVYPAGVGASFEQRLDDRGLKPGA